MNYKTRWQRILVLAAWLILGLFSGGTLAQASRGYTLTWSTVDGGGTLTGTGGTYTVRSSIGQPDAGMITNDKYSVVGGFWAMGSVNPSPQMHVYLPFVQNSEP